MYSFALRTLALGAAIYVAPSTAQDAPNGGFQFVNCTNPDQLAKAQTGTLHVGYLAQAGFNSAGATAQFVDPAPDPFGWFFHKTSQPEIDAVRSVYTLAIAAQQQKGPVINVVCGDPANACGSGTVAYAQGASGATPAQIALCNNYFFLNGNDPPCSTPFTTDNYRSGRGAFTLGKAMLHQAVRILKGDAVNNAHGHTDSHALAADPNGQPLANADNYAWLGSWAWDFGQGGNPYAGQPCVATDFQPQNLPPYPAHWGWYEDIPVNPAQP